ncbi:DoxX family protein [Microbacterium sp.]|uniref:DoxX family protein n=1 Tax=Microbacterium sp. TaxID=51671 RepID=UPI002811CCEA|nr:DoxX family protein [Microbacterium sp.]
MWIAYWAAAGSLTVLFLVAGVTKLLRSRSALKTAGMGYVDDFTDAQVKLIGAAEIAGAAGLVLPMLSGVAMGLSPVAGLSLAALMAGAIVTHARRGEPFLVPLVLAVGSVAVAVLGLLVIF